MRPRPRVLWPTTRRSAPATRAPGAAPAAAPPALPRFAHIPTVADAASPREDAVGLLQVAAEVEHALLVQYLYAAASVSNTTGTPPPNIRGKVTAVAIQEMAHLVTVQNLLLAIAGREGYHMGRDLLREQSELNPIPLVLEPLSHLALAKYIVVEQPETIEDATLRRRVDLLADEVLRETGFDPKRVGELYAAIYWIMQPTDAPFGPLTLSVNDTFRPGWHLATSDFRPPDEINRYATVVDEWHGFPNLVVDVVVDAQSGCQALYRVMAQGEGIASQPDAHFEEFLEVLDAFHAGSITVAQLPRSPYVSGQPVPADPRAVELTHSYTRPWAQLFNHVYTHVVLCLAHSLHLPVGDGVRDELRESALQGMRPLIVALSKQLQRLRVDDTGSALAAPTYGLLTEALPETTAAFWPAHRERLAMQDMLLTEIQAHADHAADPSGRTALRVVGQFQNRIRALLP
jgi:rubrerythrin